MEEISKVVRCVKDIGETTRPHCWRGYETKFSKGKRKWQLRPSATMHEPMEI